MSTRITIERALVYLLVSSAAVAAVAGDRVSPHQVTQSTTKPYVTYKRIAAQHQGHMRGASGLVYARIQLDAWAPSYATARDLYEAMRNRLQDFQGTVIVPDTANESGGLIEIDHIELVDDHDNLVPPTDAKDTGVYQFTLDVRVAAEEPIPTNV